MKCKNCNPIYAERPLLRKGDALNTAKTDECEKCGDDHLKFKTLEPSIESTKVADENSS